MRLPFIVAVIVAGIAVPAFARQTSSSANDAKIIELERATLAGFAKGDMKAFNQNISPDAFGIDGSTGLVKVADWNAMMKDIKIQKWNIDNVQVHWINKDVAVLTYRYVGTGTAMGMPRPPVSWASSIWVNQNGTWRATFHQESTAPPAPPATKK